MAYRPPVLLVASSLDDYSDGIVQAAGKFAAGIDAEIHLFHVIEQPRLSSFALRVTDGSASKELSNSFEQEKLKETLRKQALRCIPEGVNVASIDVSKSTGATYEAILGKAAGVGATAIALGPHSGTETRARFIGTTAERVLRTADIPSLILHGALGNIPAKVGAAVDLSSNTKAVLTAAGYWATACVKEDLPPVLDVLYVGWWVEREDNPSMEENFIIPRIQKDFDAIQKERSFPRELGLKTHVLWENEPIQPILNWADVHNLDLLVLGTHGLSGLRRALLGSTSSAVARRATCPILLVPPAS